MVYWRVLHLTLMQLALARGLRTLADLNLRVVRMRQHLGQIAHVGQCPADRAISEMIGLGFGTPSGSKPR
jgi:hypothetical protein